MKHRGLRLQLLFIFTSNYYIRSIKKQCSYFFQYNNLKKKIWIKTTNLSSNLEPVSLDFLIAKGMAMVAMKIFWFPIKLELRLSVIKKRIKLQLKSDTSRFRFQSLRPQPWSLCKNLKFPVKVCLTKTSKVEFML